MANLTPFPPKLSDEPNHWYRRFCVWLVMRPKRSVLEVYNQERATKGKKRQDSPPGSWDGKPELYDWDGRAKEWDKAETERLNAELALAREAWRTKEREAAEALLKKGLAGLDIPLGAALTDKTPAKGDPQAVRVAAQCITDASMLARRALEMPTERSVSNPFDKYSDEEVLQYIKESLPKEK